MDPVTTAFVEALAKSAVEPMVSDAYNALKALLARKFGHASQVAAAVQGLEANPKSDARKAVLQEEVGAAGADRDPEILQAAKDLLARLGVAAGQTGVTQSVRGNQNVFSGTGNVSANFGPGQPKK